MAHRSLIGGSGGMTAGCSSPPCWRGSARARGCPVVKPKNKHSLSHVRHDPAHCLAPGLFRALKRGERKRSKLDVTYDYGDGKRIEFSGPEPLGADDLRILQGLVAMAGPNGLVLGPEPKTEGGRQLRLFLEPKWEAVTADAMVVKGSYRALAKEIGAEVDSGGALKHIQDCIERLWKVSIIAQNGRKRQGFRLLSEYASDEADAAMYIPFAAVAIGAGAPPLMVAVCFAIFSNFMWGITEYAGGPGPIYFGQGFFERPRFYKINFILVTVSVLIVFTIGMLWWKLIGLY